MTALSRCSFLQCRVWAAVLQDEKRESVTCFSALVKEIGMVFAVSPHVSFVFPSERVSGDAESIPQDLDRRTEKGRIHRLS